MGPIMLLHGFKIFPTLYMIHDALISLKWYKGPYFKNHIFFCPKKYHIFETIKKHVHKVVDKKSQGVYKFVDKNQEGGIYICR